MIKMTVIKGVQTLTEICDTCKCHIKDLTINDILVKGKTDLIIKNDKGEEVTNTEPRPKIYCNACS